MANIPSELSELRYVRVDLAPGPDERRLLMKVKLTEPALCLEFNNGGVERLADCIASEDANK
jgi:hypothetical protein